MLDSHDAAVLEAILDPRIRMDESATPPETVDRLSAQGLLGAERREAAAAALTTARTRQPIDWVAMTLQHGEVFETFKRHCAEELDEVSVVDAGKDTLVARWRHELSRLELRAGFIGFEQLVSDVPTMLVGVLEGDDAVVTAAFLDDADLRGKLAVCDLTRLERIGTPRSSLFVYFEWFLRDAYSVRLLPAPAFTQGLIDRGIISLGMG